MSPVIHFTISLLAIIYMNLGFKNKYLLLITTVGLLPDIDHFLNIGASGVPVAYFHNIILLLFLPLILFLLFTMFEAGGYTSKYTRLFLAILVMLTGHLVMDLVAGNVIILQMSPEILRFSLPQKDLLSFDSIGTFMTVSDLIFGSWLTCVIVSRPLVIKMQSWYEGQAPDIDFEPYYLKMEDEYVDMLLLREMGVIPG